MLLETHILPRTNGTVNAEIGETRYRFAHDGNALTCEVADEEHILHLLSTGNFYPANKEDYEAAMLITGPEEDGYLAPEEVDEDVMVPPEESHTPRTNRTRKVAK